MDSQVKADDDRSLADKTKDALHHAADKTKELAHKVKDAVTGGDKVKDIVIADALDDLAEREDRIRRNKLEEEYLNVEKAKAAEKLAYHDEEHLNISEKEMMDAAELAKKERHIKLRAQFLEEERLRAAEKVERLQQKQEEQCRDKCHEAMKKNDVSTEFSGTMQTGRETSYMQTGYIEEIA